MKTVLIDTGLLAATFATIDVSDIVHYAFLALTAFKYTVDILNYRDRIRNKKKTENENK